MARKFIITFVFIFLFSEVSRARKFTHLDCYGKRYENVTLTAYYPEYNEEITERGYLDIRGKKLRTLQDYLDDRTDYVTVAMDEQLGIPYGTPVCIPELNEHFGRRLLLQVRDAGSGLKNKGYTRADICVRTETDSYDLSVNRIITLVF